MPRPHRLQVAGGIFHITSRGNRRQPIFVDDGDRMTFLFLLQNACERFGWRCHAYCLMGNHYHLLVETPNPDLSAGVQLLNGWYAQKFNRRHGYKGHLFEGRFHSVLVESQHHLLELTRYIVLNPVRAGLCRHAHEWAWSSYRAVLDASPRPAFLEVRWLTLQFGSDDEQGRRRYATFVRDGLRRARAP